MKIACFILCGICVLWLLAFGVVYVIGDYTYSNSIQSYWDLSDKASTIQQKSEYLDEFVSALEHSSLAENDALFLKTPNNSVAANMVALKSLQGRMHQIVGMNPSSFEYQQAMQQITGQEQGEAKPMLEVFEGAWWLQHHFFLWDWIAILHFSVIAAIGIMFLILGLAI